MVADKIGSGEEGAGFRFDEANSSERSPSVDAKPPRRTK
jgi:hypothetical protein